LVVWLIVRITTDNGIWNIDIDKLKYDRNKRNGRGIQRNHGEQMEKE